MGQGSTVLASEYNTWWTTLNAIRTAWDNPGTATTVTTATYGQTATADTMNALINAVNDLKNYYSEANWADYTEGNVNQGELIKYPDKMTYMLDYLQTVCAEDTTWSNNTTNTTNSTHGNDTTNTTNDVCTDHAVDTTDTTNDTDGTHGNETTNHTENGGESVNVGGPSNCSNNGTSYS